MSRLPQGLAGLLGASLIMTALTGCASGPTERSALDLEQAQSVYAEIASRPEVLEHAPVNLREAAQGLQQAENADNDEQRRHLAHAAQQHTLIAAAVAEQRAAAQRLEQLTQLRDQLQIQLSQREVERLREELDALEARQTERGVVVTLSDIGFRRGSARLAPDAVATIERLVRFMRQHPQRQMLVEGHTDATGGGERNLRLSQQRAENVRHALIIRGIKPARVSARGYGESRPIAPNDSPEGRVQNRRVEVVIQEPQLGTAQVSR